MMQCGLRWRAAAPLLATAVVACASPATGGDGGGGPSVVFGGGAGVVDAGAKKDTAASGADAGKADAAKTDAGAADLASADGGAGTPCATAADCDDSLPCTNDDCTDGQCVHTEAKSANQAKACDDGNACTDDLCDPAAAVGDACSHEVRVGSCDDGDACTGQDACNDGLCIGKTLVCNDDDPCTADVCKPATGCKSTPIADGPCDDDDACTEGESCVDGMCAGQAVDCDDQNKCTTDACDAVVGCTHQDSAAPCDDGKPCTQNDACTGGVCKGIGEDCDDKNACTTDKCLIASGTCQHANADGPCNDGEPCTTGEACTGGKCAGGTAKSCDDGKPCTTDSCKGGVCSNVAVTNCCVTAVDCDDGKPCTADTCVQSQCKHVVTCCAADAECNDGDAKCTSDACIGGQCKYTPTNAPGCCNPKIYNEGFDAGAGGWSFSNSAGQGWQVWKQAKTSQSAPAALYYGNPNLQSFDFGSSKGTATSPPIAIPANAKAKLSLQAWLDTESGLPYDALTVSIVADGGSTKIWDKTQGVPMGQWFAIESDLANYAGKSIQVVIFFDTVDSIANQGLGVLIDDVAVVNSCP